MSCFLCLLPFRVEHAVPAGSLISPVPFSNVVCLFVCLFVWGYCLGSVAFLCLWIFLLGWEGP